MLVANRKSWFSIWRTCFLLPFSELLRTPPFGYIHAQIKKIFTKTRRQAYTANDLGIITLYLYDRY